MRHNLAVNEALEAPRSALPERERAFIEDQYNRHDVILEYGCGASTLMAAGQDHSLVMAVENDKNWAERVETVLARQHPNHRVRVHWVDTGPTQAWGRPKEKKRGDSWMNYPNYALDIWDQFFFKHPDLVLVDGRFRTACFLTTMLRLQKPVTLLFDDYANRSQYQWIERFAAPSRLVGRMAKFDLEPRSFPNDELTQIVLSFLEPY